MYSQLVYNLGMMKPCEDSIISSSNICLFVSFQLPFVSLCLSVCCFSLSLPPSLSIPLSLCLLVNQHLIALHAA